MTFFTDNPLERLMVQMPEAPRREFEAPAVLLPEANNVTASLQERQKEKEVKPCG